MGRPSDKSLARSLGEFFGHIVRAVRADPRRKLIRKSVQRRQHGDVILRRTTIDEVEVRRPQEPDSR